MSLKLIAVIISVIVSLAFIVGMAFEVRSHNAAMNANRAAAAMEAHQAYLAVLEYELENAAEPEFEIVIEEESEAEEFAGEGEVAGEFGDGEVVGEFGEGEFDEDELEEDEPFTPIFLAEPIPPFIAEKISGVSFHYHAPFGHDFLKYLTVTHVNFDGEYQLGQLIVAAELADEVLEIFRDIFEARFPIHSIKLIDYFDALDYYSLAANNSSAFNFRYIAGTTNLSRHAWGKAIDINPVQNPYYRNGTIKPAIGEPYLNRYYVRPGMIVPGDAVYTAFTSRGWTWGGNWASPRDYHHFQR